MKNWIIKLLGGYTEDEVRQVLDNFGILFDATSEAMQTIQEQIAQVEKDTQQDRMVH